MHVSKVTPKYPMHVSIVPQNKPQSTQYLGLKSLTSGFKVHSETRAIYFTHMVKVPFVKVHVPLEKVNVPMVKVNVPLVKVNVPLVEIDVPLVKVNVPLVKVNVPLVKI
jgi:hypothetical protein